MRVKSGFPVCINIHFYERQVLTMSNRNEMERIIRAYTAGEKTLAEANAELAPYGISLDPGKNLIRPGEENRFGLLDTGTGSMDKVEVRDGELVNCDVGTMPADFYFGGRVYAVHGRKLEAKD